MRILIAGGAGEVGRHLAKDFSRQGDEIRVPSTGHPEGERSKDPSTALEGQFVSALRDCLNTVKKERS